jgi:hypothetical protein
MQNYRYYVRSPDGRAIYGFDRLDAAETAAKAYGDGAHLVDTKALTYEPMVQVVKDGDIVYFGISGWDTNRLDASQNMVEGIRNGHVAIVHAFIAKGADVNRADKNGGTPLHWAAARGLADIVRLLLDKGADATAVDADGDTPLDVARGRNKLEVAEILAKVMAGSRHDPFGS